MSAELRTCLSFLWAATALGVIGAAGLGVGLADAPPPTDAVEPAPRTALALLGHNALVALWPAALAAIGWSRIPGARTAGDVLAAGQLAIHGLLVGGAVGQQPDLWRFLPHLPLEWLGLAAPVAGWVIARRGVATHRRLAALAAGAVAALAAAAVVETWAVPL